MNKKKIITNTVIFVFVLAFVLVFKSIFGADNKVIGVTTLVAVFMLLERDFTGEPLIKYNKIYIDKFINRCRGSYCSEEYVDSNTH